MNFLGMGPAELMLILVLALIVFGPGKLPEIAGQVGKAVRDVRRMTTDLSSEFHRTLSLEVEEQKASEEPAVAVQQTAPDATVATPAATSGVAPGDSGWVWDEAKPVVSSASSAHVGAAVSKRA